MSDTKRIQLVDTGPSREILVGNVREGDVIADRYRIGPLLGAGGMGVVVAATNVAKGERVAIKLMQGSRMPGRNEKNAARMLREAKATSSLRDPYVVRALDVGSTEDGTYYLVMEMLDGEDLARYIKENGPLPLVDAVRFVLEASSGVAEAHSIGIVHRDLKPQNLFLARQTDGRRSVKVLDFGISKIQDGDGDESALTTTGASLGSPQYMSFEQFRNARTVDHRTDIWSMGMILQFLLTGHTAYEAETVAAFLFKLTTATPTPVRQHRPDLPEELERIVLRCIDRDPNRRFANLAEFAHALAPFGGPGNAPLVASIAAYAARTPNAVMVVDETTNPPSGPVADTFGADSHAPVPVSTQQGISAPTEPPAGHRSPRRVAAFSACLVLVAAGIALGGPRLFGSKGPAETTMVEAAHHAEAAKAPVGDIVPADTANITVRLTLAPEGAVVELDGVKSVLPLVLPRDGKTHRIVVKAPDHQDETREFVAQNDASLEITLKPMAALLSPTDKRTPSKTGAPAPWTTKAQATPAPTEGSPPGPTVGSPPAPTSSEQKGPRFKGPMEQSL